MFSVQTDVRRSDDVSFPESDTDFPKATVQHSPSDCPAELHFLTWNCIKNTNGEEKNRSELLNGDFKKSKIKTNHSVLLITSSQRHKDRLTQLIRYAGTVMASGSNTQKHTPLINTDAFSQNNNNTHVVYRPAAHTHSG